MITFHGSKNTLRHPTEPRALKKGEEFEAPEYWLRQHLPYVHNGTLTGEASKPKKAPAKKKPTKKAK